MEKTIQSMIAGVVVVAVAASALFFCCVDKIAHASSLKVKNAAADPCCKGDRADQQKNDKPCPCFFKEFTVSQAQLSARTASMSNALYSQGAIPDLIKAVYAASLSTDHRDDPPEQHGTVPLYLQYRSIRI